MSARRDAGPVRIRGDSLTVEEVVAVAREGMPVAELEPETRSRMEKSRRWVEAAVEEDGRAIYGVNTGFGSLATQRIERALLRRLSHNVILKCVTGVGPPLPEEWVRATMLIRANSLARGCSGVRPEVVAHLLEMLNRGVTPWVPAKGSLGASGDLAPLAHIAAVLVRGPEEGACEDEYSGLAWFENELLSGAEAMRRAGIPRLPVEAKEGLALTNGTAMMAAAAALGVHDAADLMWHAEVAAALSLEALQSLSAAFHPALQEVSGQPGQVRVAADLRALFSGSRWIDAAPGRVQDAYSLRCIPQVLGPVVDLMDFLRQRIEGAINAAADNPLVFPDLDREGRALSGGNFHGQGLALWLDILGIGVAEVASLAERRIFRLLTPELSAGLPAMLVPSRGVNSGLMAAQYTAAALVSDNKTLAHPDSVDSIPTCANQEDHVSMGANAARHALEILANVRTVVAIELLAAAQAISLRPEGPERLGRGTRAAYEMLRTRVDPLERDRALTPDIEKVERLIREGGFRRAVDRVLPPTPSPGR